MNPVPNNQRDSALEISSGLLCEDYRECPEILGSILEIFLETFPADLDALRRAHVAGDGVQVAFLAHKMRGSVLAFHQDDAARVASELEEKAKREQLQGTENLIDSLGDAYEKASATVKHAEQLLTQRISPNSIAI